MPTIHIYSARRDVDFFPILKRFVNTKSALHFPYMPNIFYIIVMWQFYAFLFDAIAAKTQNNTVHS